MLVTFYIIRNIFHFSVIEFNTLLDNHHIITFKLENWIRFCITKYIYDLYYINKCKLLKPGVMLGYSFVSSSFLRIHIVLE